MFNDAHICAKVTDKDTNGDIITEITYFYDEKGDIKGWNESKRGNLSRAYIVDVLEGEKYVLVYDIRNGQMLEKSLLDV